MPSCDRARIEQKKNESLFFLKRPFKQEDKSLAGARDRVKNKEVGPGYRFRPRTDKDRIDEFISNNSGKDFTEKNNKMVHFSNWRSTPQHRNKKDFVHHYNIFDLKTSPPWEVPKGTLNSDISNNVVLQYKEGLESLADKMTTRKRRKEREVSDR